uniref:Carn_acyltransf domain-containing protein n=1 Tax=Ganoderma boninense TaxID=34458 RepID=A0A5K1JUA9_9APHY|nr:Carn_acyltransf domain-containing protein [Ganoderma boninense]
MQRYSNPEVFLCPYYNVPGISNPKMSMAKEGVDKALPSSPASAIPQGLIRLTTRAPARSSASTPSSSPSSSRDNSLSPEPSSSLAPDAPRSDSERKADDYERIFDEMIDAE